MHFLDYLVNTLRGTDFTINWEIGYVSEREPQKGWNINYDGYYIDYTLSHYEINDTIRA